MTVDRMTRWKQARDVAKVIATACHCDRLRRATRAVTTIYDAWLGPTGLRLPELVLLSTIWSSEHQSLGMSVLADRLETHRTTISRNVSVATKHGFLWREGHRVQLTPRGWDAVAEAIPLWKQAEEEVVPRISRDDERTMNRVLETLIRLSDERWDPIPESG